ncbi:alpha/beta hydrolase [Sediminicola sp. 1XM1-17]|uniref:alpha/beta hydrolase n=1 Tax=Sediminicola sp. 1XM1-17 TaxID=3127702 RepID=UPI003076BCD7
MHQEFFLPFKKYSIAMMYTQPQVVKGVAVLCHGFGEHYRRYLPEVIPMLENAGLAVVAYDNFGHGQTGGKRGHCPNYESLLELLDLVIERAQSLYPQKPLFLYGHSMGGNLVLNFAMRRKHNIRGIIATSPYLRLAFDPPKWKMILGRAMLNIFPSLTLPSGLDTKGISRIPEEVVRYKNDPLVHDKVSPMFSLPIMDAGEWAIANSNLMEVSTLLVHGTADPIIDHRGTLAFHENANTTTLELMEGGYHELHKDLCSKEMLGLIKNWLGQQL